MFGWAMPASSLLAIFCVFYGSTTSAVSGDDLVRQLDVLIEQERQSDSLFPAQSASALLALLQVDERVAQAPALTKDLVARVVLDDFVRAKTSVKEAQALADLHVKKLPIALDPESATRLLEILVPYVQAEGFCSGDPLSVEGASCAFFYAPAEFGGEISFAGAYESPQDGALVNIPTASATSAVYEILSGCTDGNEFCALSPLSSLLSPVQTMAFTSGSVSGSDSGTRDANYSTFRVRVPWAAWWYFKYTCTFSCKVWGEIYAAGNIQYLANASDSFAAHLPMVLYCSGSCYWHTVGDYILDALGFQHAPSGQEMLDFMVDHADHRYGQIRQSGSYLRHIEKSPCMIAQPYETRPAYRYFQEWKSDLPYSQFVDWDFQTNFQEQSTSPTTALMSTNMVPLPTSATGPTPQINQSFLANLQTPVTVDRTWTYNFTEVRGWMANLIFAGADNAAYPTNPCGTDLSWIWHGQASSGKYSMPTVDWTFSVYGSHAPLVTAQAGCQNGVQKSWGACYGKVYSSNGAIGVFGRASNSRPGYTGEARFSCSGGNWSYMDGTCQSSSGPGDPPLIP